MAGHCSHSGAFKRQVAEEFIAGGTLHALSKRHDISRQPQPVEHLAQRVAALPRLFGRSTRWGSTSAHSSSETSDG